MEQAKINEILELHSMWLKADPKGVRADLRYANLRSADLSYADLRYADLSYADLRYADLTYANLSSANLSYADLRYANLTYANLSSANLSSVDLRYADLRSADLDKEVVNRWTRVCPEEGSFYGYKRVSSNAVLVLYIPRSAQRLTAFSSRKCRADKVKVVSAQVDGKPTDHTEFNSIHDTNFKYTVGKWAKADGFDDDARNECSHGIHFFITKKEAEEWT